MTATACPSLPSFAPAATRGSDVGVEIIGSIGEARALIQRLTLSGMATPYQSLAFLSDYIETVDAPMERKPALVVLKDEQGEALMLLPLSLKRIGPVTVAEFVGGKHSNFNLPILGPGAGRLTAASLRDALVQTGRQAGIDVYVLINQPESWEGTPNPIHLLGGQPSPSNGYRLGLALDAEALVKAKMTKDTLRKIKQKAAKLSAIGTVTHRRAETDAEAWDMLQTFFRLKAASFRTKGIDDPFEAPEVRTFLERGCTLRHGETRPLIEMHGLYVDERLVSVYGGVLDHRRFSGLITAYDPDPEIARGSPGDVLLLSLIKQCCTRGITTFDLGVGEAHYKDKFCNEAELLFDTVLPVTTSGWVLGSGKVAFLKAKRWVKHSPIGKALIARIRKTRAAA